MVVIALCVITGFSGMDPWILLPATVILFREVFVSGLREFLGDTAGTLKVTKLAKWKTTAQMIAIAVLFATGLRALGIPARVGLARVRNHLGTEKLERLLGTDVLTPHGYAAHWNGRRWVKSTPVFNRELCERLGTAPLDWTPEVDSQFQPMDGQGRRFMEYLEDYGLFDALPRTFLHAELRREYPHCFDADGRWRLPEA